ITGTDTVTSSITGTQSGIIVNPAGGTALKFVQQPTNTAATATITPAITVQVIDAYGNNVASGGVSVSMAIKPLTGTAGAILSGTNPQSTNASGLATFNDLSI